MLIKMSFRSFVWPDNPRIFEAEYTQSVHTYKLPFGGFITQNLGNSAKVFRGEGEFVGPDAYDDFRDLVAEFETNLGGPLVHPLWPVTNVYFTKLSLKEEPRADYVSYSFEFREYIPET